MSSQSMLDVIRHKWAEKCSNHLSAYAHTNSQTELGITDRAIGWALKVKKKAKRYNKEVKMLMDQRFKQGETGTKVRPEDVVSDIRSQFGVSDWLTVNQVQSYFSRLASVKSVMVDSNSQNVMENEMANIQAVQHRALQNEMIQLAHATQ